MSIGIRAVKPRPKAARHPHALPRPSAIAALRTDVFVVVACIAVLSLAIVVVALLAPHSARPLVLRAATNAPHLAAFLAIVLFIGATTEALTRARRAAERQSADLIRLNAALEDQMEEVRTLSDHLERTNEELSQALESTRQTAARASALQEVTAALSLATTVSDVADAVLTRGLAAVGAVRGCLVLIDEAGTPAMIRAAGYSDTELHVLHDAVTSVDGLFAQAMRDGRGLWLHEPIDCDACLSRTVHSRLALPLTRGAVVVGALGCDFMASGIEKDTDSLFLGLLAQASADAIRRARRHDEANEARRAAELRSRMREEVLSVVAHDLRNPLHLVASSAELLMMPELDDERRRSVLAIAKRAVHRMNRMVGDLLNVVRMEAGRFTLELKTCDANRVVRDAVDALCPAAAERGINLVAHVADEPIPATMDEERVLQLLDNLIGNALKFTPRGGRVTVSAAMVDDEVTVAVADTGPGISPEHCARLFERFWQARGTDRRGIGLGLTIAKGIAEAHGGRLAVRSTDGAGSVFLLCLPNRS
jgi:signal transduction histidine kinase